MDTITAVLAGAAIGVATGLMPGVHVNLLAALALAIPGLPESAAWGLVAVGVVHSFVCILPTTYLGAPDGDSALSVLPAHQLLHEGAGPEAVRISLHASMLAALTAVAVLWPLALVVHSPAVLPALEAAAPLVLLAVPTWLILRDGRRLHALLVAALAALLGHVAFDWPVHGWVPGAATPLLPLLSGLFGVPTLLWALRTRAGRPLQDPPPSQVPAGSHRAAWRGVAAAGFTAILPGLTAAVATAMALPGRSAPRRVLSTLSAVNTAHLIIAMSMLWMIGKTRSGLAISWQAMRPAQAWARLPPPDVMTFAAVVLAAGALAVVATMALDQGYQKVLGRVRAGVPEALALAFIVALTALTTGWTGLLLLAVAAVTGIVPLVIGTRRVHLAACLSIPIAIRLAL